MLNIKQTLLDRVISHFAPQTGAKRMHARAQMAVFNRTQGYDQAGSNKRFLQSVNVDANSPDYDTLDKKEGAVALSRDLWMNNSLAQAALKRVKSNTVGTGLKLQSRIQHDVLGLTVEQAREWQRDVERRFNSWAASKDVDITRQQNFFELQDLVYFSTLLSGDICVLYPQKEVPTLKSPVRIRLIESDLLSNPALMPDTAKVAGGIELNDDGSPAYYYFASAYPGGNIYGTDIGIKHTKIPAFTSTGRRQVHHLFIKERPGQRRGMPLLAPVVNDLIKITKLKDAELTAHVISSFFTVFIKDMSGFAAPMAEGFTPPGLPSATDIEGGVTDNANQYSHSMGSGNVLYLDDDKEIQIADPRRMSDAFEPFFMSFVKQLSASIELPFEQLLLHFSASYSASRGALLEGWKATRVRRTWLETNFCKPTFQAWLDYAVASGQISAPGYFEDEDIRTAWSNTSWSGMGNGQLDPLKESKAAVMKIQNNLSTHEHEYNQMHDDGDWEGAMDRRENEQSLLIEKDLLPLATVDALTEVKEDNISERRDPNRDDGESDLEIDTDDDNDDEEE